MICNKCGREIPDGSPFCKYCGATQATNPNSTNVNRVEQPTPAPKPQQQPQQPQQQPNDGMNQAAQKAGELAQNATQKAGELAASTSQTVQRAFENSGAMFDNIGDKICGLAKIVCWIGIGFSVLMGLGIMLGGCAAISDSGIGVAIATFFGGLFVAAIGSLVSWLSCLQLYAYGEITRRTQAIEEHTRK